ncbi:hypothetical protein KC361_g5399 [Hortaea werneckii]|nr:hypothetical protein KC361_g5399 [Hortaea werneckii]
MSAKACAPDDVFNKYCAELSVPRLITTWSIEMSKQQLVSTLSNRGYRFDLNQFSADQLLQLLRESNVLYHQIKNDCLNSKPESITAATVQSGKGKEPEQTTQHFDSGASGIQAQPEINSNLPRVHSKVRVEDAVSVAREKEHISQGNSDRQAVAESPPADSSSQLAQGERQEGVLGGKRKSNLIFETEGEMEQEGKKKTKGNEIDSEYKQRVDMLQSRLLHLAIKSGTHGETTIKVRRLEGRYDGFFGLMTDVFKEIKDNIRETWEWMEMRRGWGDKLAQGAVDKMTEARAEIPKIEALLAQLQERY